MTESFLPTTNGVTNSVLRVNQELVAAGIEVKILAPSAPGLCTEVHGTQVIPLPALNLQKHLPIAFPNLKVFRELEKFNPDVVHLASPAIMGAHAQRTAMRLGKPTVAVYQTDFVGFARHYKFAFAKRAIQQCVKVIHSEATLNLAPSTFAINQLNSIGIKQVHRWGRGVDLEQFNPKNRCQDTYIRFGNKKVIGYVGRLAPEKSIERLIPLANRDDVQLVIIGTGPSEKELKRLMPRAHFTGKLHGSELAEHFAGLDLFIHPGDSETFCQAAQEALSSGVPVIAPNKGGLRDFVHHGKNGLVLDFSRKNVLAEITEQQWSLLWAPTTRELCRESVLENSWQNITRQLINFYHKSISLYPSESPSIKASLHVKEIA